MARTNMDAWVPEERGSAVLATVGAQSAVEALARREPMASDTKSVPRSGGVDVDVTPKGAAYAENDNVDDEVTLRARKFTGLLRIAEEDLADIPENVVAMKQQDWARSYARVLDNSVLGTTGAENGTTVPFTSVYAAVAAYNSASNRIQTAGAVTYADLSAVFGLVENGDYFGDSETVVIAHPSFRGVFRTVTDGNGSNIFDAATNGTPDRLFGYQVAWSAGARTSATKSANPAGNPLLVVANKNHLILGIRSGPESAVINGFTGASALTDEALIKMRSRRGFVLGHASAAAVLEVTAS